MSASPAAAELVKARPVRAGPKRGPVFTLATHFLSNAA